MTEDEWLACQDIRTLLEYLTERASGRKFRLFGCACCRRIRHLLNDQARHAVSVAERYADGLATEDGVEAARRDMISCRTQTALTPGLPAKYSWAYSAAELVLFDTPFWKPNKAEQWAFGAAWTAAEGAWRHDGGDGPAEETTHQLALLRDVFENPYRPGWVDPAVLIPSVVSLAEVIYADRAFDRLPILADALQDAGCDDSDILDHCRGGGPHVRGCWVVDLVLGKA
jgi:hypothetical protein